MRIPVTPVDYWRAGMEIWCRTAEVQGAMARSAAGMMSVWATTPADRIAFLKKATAQPRPDEAVTANPGRADATATDAPRRAGGRRGGHATPV